MIHFNDQAINFVKEIIVISNTPAFLCKRVKDSEYTLDLASLHSANELYSELKNISNENVHTPSSLAITYTLLCALSIKADFDLRKLNEIDLSWVEWSRKILSIIDMSSESRDHIKIETIPVRVRQHNAVSNDPGINEIKVNISPIKQKASQNEI